MDEPLLDTSRPAPIGMGHNQGPSALSLIGEALADATDADVDRIFEMLVDHLCIESPASTAARETLIGLGEIWQFGGTWKGKPYEPVKVIESDARMERAEKLVADLNVRIKVEEDARKRAKDGFLHKGRMVDTLFNARKARLETIKVFLLGLLGARAKALKAERDIAAAEAQRIAQEADRVRREREIEASATANLDTTALQRATEASAEANAVARQVARAPVIQRAVGATRTVVARHYSVEVVDIRLVPAEYLQVKEGDALMALKAGTVIPGLALRTEERAHVR